MSESNTDETTDEEESLTDRFKGMLDSETEAPDELEVHDVEDEEFNEVVYLGGQAGVRTPYEKEIIREAVENLNRKDQQRIAEEHDIEEEELIERIAISYDFDDPFELLDNFAQRLMNISDDIADQIMTREEERDNTNPFERKEGYMAYLIDKVNTESGEMIIFGGANSIIFNLADSLDLTDDERRLIIEANKIAAKYSNISHHTEIENVLYAPVKDIEDNTDVTDERVEEHVFEGEKEDKLR